MNVEVDTLPNCLATLRVEVPSEKVTPVWDTVAREFSQYAKLPGFRPGKVPRNVIELKFKKQIREEVQQKVMTQSVREAIAEKKLRVLSIENVEDVEFADDKALRYTATVVTAPEFEIPEYKGIAVEAKPTTVTDEEVNEAVENLRERSADFNDVADRGLQMDDYAVIDYTGTIDGKLVQDVFEKAGKPLSTGADFWIRMTGEAFFPGFTGKLIDAKVGETREFDIEVPADFVLKEMAAQKIHYVVTVKGVKQKVLPELNDEFAGKVIEGKTLAELRDLIKADLAKQKEIDADRDRKNQIMAHLLSKVECELPQGLVRNEARRIMSEIVRENQARGVPDEALKENEKDIVGSATQSAKDRLKGTFILVRIAEQEKIAVTKSEFDQRIAMLAARHGMPLDKIKSQLAESGGLDQIEEEILTGKVLDFLASNASVATKSA
jgi:trigger factor